MSNIQVRNDPENHKVILDIEYGACVVSMSPEYAVKVMTAMAEAVRFA